MALVPHTYMGDSHYFDWPDSELRRVDHSTSFSRDVRRRIPTCNRTSLSMYFPAANRHDQILQVLYLSAIYPRREMQFRSAFLSSLG